MVGVVISVAGPACVVLLALQLRWLRESGCYQPLLARLAGERGLSRLGVRFLVVVGIVLAAGAPEAAALFDVVNAIGIDMFAFFVMLVLRDALHSSPWFLGLLRRWTAGLRGEFSQALAPRRHLLAGPTLGLVISLAVAEVGILRVLRCIGWVLRPRSWL